MTDLERVARAMDEADAASTDPDSPFRYRLRDLPADPKDFDAVLKAAARAALLAIEEPSEGMIAAHQEVCAGDADEASPAHIREAWRAMIRHILEEGEKT